MGKKLELIGERFGRLVVVRELEKHSTPSGHSTRKYLCKCDCGNEKEVVQNSLRSGATQSCGCYRIEQLPTNRKSAELIYFKGVFDE